MCCMTVYGINISIDQSTVGMYHVKATGSSLACVLFIGHWLVASFRLWKEYFVASVRQASLGKVP
jgi:hypothetical protein